jgi:hypothetical protein
VTSAAPETQPEQPVPAEEAVSVAPVEAQAMAEERDEFAAALESLSPANGHGVPQQFSGPRWTAELVAVTDAESALVLEQEMQKAVAALAAVHADETRQSAPASEVPAHSNTADLHTEDLHQEAVEPPAERTSLVAAMTEATINETALPTLSDLVDSVLPRVSAEAATSESQGAAFAAAAAGSNAVSQSALPSEVPPSGVSSSNADERQRESELAAAWESWKHIRESVVDAAAATQIPTQNLPEAAPVSTPDAESDGEPGSQEESVASIVDSVLADLKPRLMEEISKKMSKEKKSK